MSVGNGVISVAAAATALSATERDTHPGQSLALKNIGAVTVYLGAATVTADTTTTGGFQLAAGDAIGIDLGEGEQLYGIVATGTCNVAVLRTGI